MDSTEGPVTDRVFETFLKDLEAAGIDEATRQRLRKTLLEDRKYSDVALRAAVFGGSELPL